MAGTLYLVGTPIGNLEDITLRALRILREVDLIAAEDTRQTRRLLHHHGIRTPLLSYHAHNEAARVPDLVQRLREGQNIALVTDAGMPGISDPGRLVVDAALKAGLPVRVVPGPSAAVAALALAGLPAGVWLFAGFLPRRPGSRREALQAILTTGYTAVLYEAPHRVVETLADLAALAPDRQVAVCRELTKQFEEVRRGRPAELAEHFRTEGARGEFTLVIGPPAHSSREPGEEPGRVHPALPGTTGGSGSGGEEALWQAYAARVRQLEDEGLDPREATRRVAREYGVRRRDVYQAVLRVRSRGAGPRPDGAPGGS
ncbi:16S rRNA (cytidine(1402)-2'-O)-methyltransferase [Caldinitratiruptor microaerophilus]|uniref:Ribosomal RNA small subunit methyltransferase I n=1 Tax=Caldinitratiruptor microaerophilus TaxID=671077 RepID=A0AA35G9D5_9FIRM|nr:16S rRNA (cytidine(1402)-2'-O)-methyltransferase [Caldinitratiruptor microaerophilus]BDG61986.1 ribosomal RNA small subunit methyltransferase I [Caldinitratiruptor microaerophilus]